MRQALSGGRLERIEQRSDQVVVTVSGARSAVFSAERRDSACRLLATLEKPTDANGRPMMEDAEGRTIVRVQQADEELSLHLDDGEIFHVLAVENEDGCRVATRQEREHGRGLTSLLDRALGRIRGGRQ